METPAPQRRQGIPGISRPALPAHQPRPRLLLQRDPRPPPDPLQRHRAALSHQHLPGHPQRAADAATARPGRSRFIYEGNHRFVLLAEEAVLRYRIGDPEVMAGQLGKLLD
ncbi:Scr1 family TA system antitoxin-like transcriptional regulator [Streptomyces sp. NPDC056061]|uniref:Scr1 family TA system antitoxin-like transcriptional regulator n=1 Tax=Streptomyces sp. NPDC056061 TaxID=3345700 RepID=UPI0035D6EAF6